MSERALSEPESVISRWSIRAPAIGKIIQLASEVRIAKDLPEFADADPWPHRPPAIVEAEQADFDHAVQRIRAERDERRRTQAYKLGRLQLVTPPAEMQVAMYYYFIEEPEITCSLQSYYATDGLGKTIAADRLNVFNNDDRLPGLPKARLSRVNLGRIVKGRDPMIPFGDHPSIEFLRDTGMKLRSVLDNHESQVRDSYIDSATPAEIVTAPDVAGLYPSLQVVPQLPRD